MMMLTDKIGVGNPMINLPFGMLDTTHKIGDFGDGSYFVYLITILNHHLTIMNDKS